MERITRNLATAAKVTLFAAWLVALWWALNSAADGLARVVIPQDPTPPAAFGLAKLRNPTAGSFLGIYVPGVPQEMRLLDEIENRVRRRFTMISLYQAWGSKPEQQFDARALNQILRRGAIPVLTWEPWVTDFVEPGLPPMPQRQFRNLRAIADGQYDFYIERWAHEAKRWGGPLMIRLGHEMNATWYPWGEKAFANTAADFVAMWRHVVTVFRRVGADNVIWVWSPARRPFEGLFPGSDYVDWTGITILNFGTVPPGWRWESFAELFAPHYEQLKAFGKPIMIAEVASAEEGGSKAEWILQAMASLRTDFPLVRAFVWFNEPQDRFWPINWSLTSSEEAARAFRRAVRDPYFIAPPR